MSTREDLKQNVGQWLASPRRVLVDILFLCFSLILFYTGSFGMECEVTEPGYVYCGFIRLLYYVLGIFCVLFLTTAFIEGRLKPIFGRWGVEPMRNQSSITDLNIDPSKYEIRETEEGLELIPTENEATEINPERNE